MSHAIQSYAEWLADYYLLSTVLLALTLFVVALLKQPAQRLAVTKSTLVASFLLAVLCAIPGWSAVHLLTAERTKPTADSPQSVSATPGVTSTQSPRVELAPTTLDSATSLPSPPLPPGEGRGEGAFSHVSLPTIFATVHLSGAACVFTWLLLGWLAAARLRRTAHPAPPYISALLHQLNESSHERPHCVQLLTHDQIDVAVALGIWRPAILLPLRWLSDVRFHNDAACADSLPPSDTRHLTPDTYVEQRPPRDELRSILAHESTHIANHDLQWIALARILLIALWANPLFWLTRRHLRLDQESLADAAAAELTTRQQYAEQLIAWARNLSTRPALHLSSAVGLWERPSQLRQRIAILLNDRFTVLRNCSRCWRITAAVLAIVTAVTLSMVSLQPASRAEEKEPAAREATEKKPSTNTAKPAVMNNPVPNVVPNTASGRVVDDNDKPIAGAEVFLFRVNQHDGTRQQLGKNLTNAEGRFRFQNVIDIDKEFPGRKYPPSYEVGNEMLEGATRAPGRVTITWLMMPQTVAKTGEYHAENMLPAATLRGRVTDTNGKPVAGALVSIGGGELAHWEGAQASRADADGYYKIEDAAPFHDAEFKKQTAERKRQTKEQEARGTPTYSVFVRRPILRVEHPDYAVKQTNLEKSPGTQDVVVEPPAVLEGRVVFAGSAKPAPGALVGIVTSLDGINQPPAPTDLYKTFVRTDREGKYRVRSLPAGKYTVWADAPGWVNVGVNGVAAAAGKTTSVPDLILSKGGIVSARIVDAKTHQPIPVPPRSRTMMLIDSASGPTLRPMEAPFITVNSKGRFELQLPPGKKKVGAGGVEIDGELKFSGPPSIEVSVVEGKAVDVDLPVTELSAQPGTNPGQPKVPTSAPQQPATTVPQHSSRVFADQSENMDRSANKNVQMRCIDENGHPVANAEIYLYQCTGGKNRQYIQFGPFTSDAQGRAAFKRACFSDQQGNFDRWIYARVPGRLVGVARSVKWRNEKPFNAEAQVVLKPSRSVAGRVTVPPGFDPTVVTVFVRTIHVFTGPEQFNFESFPREKSFPGLNTALPEIFERRPDAEGRIRFDDVPVEGRLYLVTRARGLGEAQWWNGSRNSHTFEEPIEINIEKEARLLGRVFLPDGKPAGGMNVAARIIKDAPYLSTFSATTNSNGEFAIEGLPRRQLVLSITDPSLQWVFRPLENVQIAPGKSKSLTLTIERGVMVRGRVLDEEGKPVTGASLSAITDTEAGPGVGDSTTDANGRYHFLLPAGGTRLYFNALPEGFAYPRPEIVKRLDIKSGQQHIENLDFTLHRTHDA